jgi:carbamoyl-phosphate synthase large subunit
VAASAEPTNLLLTFSGRKAYVYAPLARSSQAGAIVAADADPEAPIRATAHHFACVPPVSQASAYLAALEQLCKSHSIDAIQPLNDLDLRLLTSERERFAACDARVLGASGETTAILCDKLQAAHWLSERGFCTPRTWRAGDPGAPRRGVRIAKERFGQGSQGFRVLAPDEDPASLAPTLVVQPFVEGRHFDLDVLRAASGDVVAVVAKEKLEMAGGTASKTRSVLDRRLIELGIALGRAVEHVGLIDVDVIAAGDRLTVLEINPRLGGCFPFACLFCPGLPDALLVVARGESPAPMIGSYRDGVTAFREWSFVEAP